PVDDVGGFEEGGEIWLPVCVRDDLRHDVRDGGRNEFRRHRRCCPREFFHEGRCWRFPPPCPRDEIKLRNGECCPRQDVRDGECHKIPPRDCPPHEIKLPNGQC